MHTPGLAGWTAFGYTQHPKPWTIMAAGRELWNGPRRTLDSEIARYFEWIYWKQESARTARILSYFLHFAATPKMLVPPRSWKDPCPCTHREKPRSSCILFLAHPGARMSSAGAHSANLRSRRAGPPFAPKPLRPRSWRRPCCRSCFKPCTRSRLFRSRCKRDSPRTWCCLEPSEHLYPRARRRDLLVFYIRIFPGVHKRLPVQRPEEILRVVDRIEAVAFAQKQFAELWESRLQAVYLHLRNIHLRHENCERVPPLQLLPLFLHEPVGVRLYPFSRGRNCAAAYVGPSCDRVQYICLRVLLAVQSLSNAPRNRGHDNLRRPARPGRTRDPARLGYAVFCTKTSVHIHIVHEGWEAFDGLQSRPARGSLQVVHLRDVGNKVAPECIFQEEMGCHRFLGIEPHIPKGSIYNFLFYGSMRVSTLSMVCQMHCATYLSKTEFRWLGSVRFSALPTHSVVASSATRRGWTAVNCMHTKKVYIPALPFFVHDVEKLAQILGRVEKKYARLIEKCPRIPRGLVGGPGVPKVAPEP